MIQYWTLQGMMQDSRHSWKDNQGAVIAGNAYRMIIVTELMM